jgi:hypothetical protein
MMPLIRFTNPPGGETQLWRRRGTGKAFWRDAAAPGSGTTATEKTWI